MSDSQSATRSILGGYQDGQMDLDDIIEALRPIQMRIRQIDGRVYEIKKLGTFSAQRNRSDKR